MVPVTPRPRVPPGIVRVELEKPSAAFPVRPSGDSGSTRVFGEQYVHPPLACSLIHPDFVDIA